MRAFSVNCTAAIRGTNVRRFLRFVAVLSFSSLLVLSVAFTFLGSNGDKGDGVGDDDDEDEKLRSGSNIDNDDDIDGSKLW